MRFSPDGLWKGGQTRGYLDIRDTLNCVLLSVEQPAQNGQLRIFNQFTETFSVNELAAKVQSVGKHMDLPVQVRSIDNPRVEKEEHYYNPAHTGLVGLGLKPHPLTDDVLAELIEYAMRNKDRIDVGKIVRGIKWA